MSKYFKRPIVVIGLVLVIIVILVRLFYLKNEEGKVAKETLKLII